MEMINTKNFTETNEAYTGGATDLENDIKNDLQGKSVSSSSDNSD